MIRSIDLDELELTLSLLSLQQIAYRIEAELIGFTDIPPLLDSPQTLKDSGESFFGYFNAEEKLIGASSCKQGVRELTICRMMVAPECFRKGIASALLEHMEQCAVPGMKIKVSAGTNNTPAFELYTKHGYVPVQQHLVAPGITLTQFQKIAALP